MHHEPAGFGQGYVLVPRAERNGALSRDLAWFYKYGGILTSSLLRSPRGLNFAVYVYNNVKYCISADINAIWMYVIICNTYVCTYCIKVLLLIGLYYIIYVEGGSVNRCF